MADNALPFLSLVLGFGFIIFVHELGHFLVAKWVGIRCTQFAIGFGQSLLTYRKGLGIRVGTTEKEYEAKAIEYLEAEGVVLDDLSEQDRALRIYEAGDQLGMGETEYRLNWMPLGGYVKMLGQEDMDPTAQSQDPRAFNRKPIWARACVISAGVVMNLIFGIIFFILAFTKGVEFPAAVVGGVQLGSPASQAYPVEYPDNPEYRGLQLGDKVIAVDGEEISDMMELAGSVALAPPNKQLMVRVYRPTEDRTLNYPITPVISQTKPKVLSLGVGSTLDLHLPEELDPAAIADVLSEKGVKPGMHISAVDGNAIERFDQFQTALAEARGHKVAVTFTDEKTGENATVWISAVPALAQLTDKEERNLLGFAPPTLVPMVMPGSPADKAGLQAGDVIARLGNNYWPTGEQIRNIVQSTGDRAMLIDVLREGRIVSLGQVTPEMSANGPAIGIGLAPAIDDTRVGRTLAGYSGWQLHLASGSRIMSINETPVENWTQLQRKIQEIADLPESEHTITIGYELNTLGRPVESRSVTLTKKDLEQIAEAQWQISPEYGPLPLPTLMTTTIADSPVGAAKLGVEKTHYFMVQTYQTIARLFQGTVKVNHLRGPVGIVHIGTNVAKKGWTYLLFFLGLISINLVVINFLPIPIVDGGLMVFLIVEKIKGSPVGPKVQTVATMIGLAMIGSIFVTTLFFDVSRLFTGG